MIDIICRCGHSKNVHQRLGNEEYGATMCLAAGPDTLVQDCPCYEYTPDNLLHIEQMAKERKLT